MMSLNYVQITLIFLLVSFQTTICILHQVFVTFLCNTGFPFTLTLSFPKLKTLVCYNSSTISLKF